MHHRDPPASRGIIDVRIDVKAPAIGQPHSQPVFGSAPMYCSLQCPIPET
jgi:hypothetical protein